MKKTIVALVTAIVAGATLGAAPAAHASDVQQLCVDFGDDGRFSAHLAEDYETWEAVRGHRATAFVNSVAGCSGLGAGDGEVWDGENPYPAPAGDHQAPATAAPAPVSCEPAEVRTVEAVRAVEVPAQADAGIQRRVERQAAKIARLKAKLAQLKRR